ncbi:MAG: transporter substrate-binding domain-containing protein [Bifidobacterium catenulatum]
MSRLSRNIAALVCAASVVLGTSACGTSISVVTNGLAQGPTIAIGVAADQPGLGFLHGGEYSGFDISVSQYVANTLGFAQKQIVFKQVLPSTRVSSLEDGTVDMVVDAFAADDVQDGEVEPGPYLTVHAALLVRSDSAGTITGIDDLAGKTVCVAKDGMPADSVRNLAEDVTVSERDTYPQCETALMIGQADAIAADDAIAAGLASNRGGGYLKVVGETFGERSYAIAVKPGQSTLAEQVDAALQSMMDDGSWKQAMDEMKQSIGYVPDMSINPPAITRSAASEG